MNQPAPFANRVTTKKTITYHFITSAPKRSTTTSKQPAKSPNIIEDFKYENLNPTTYSPSKSVSKLVKLQTSDRNNSELKTLRKSFNPIDINNEFSPSNGNSKVGPIRNDVTTPYSTNSGQTTKVVPVARSLIAEINQELKPSSNYKQNAESSPKRTFQATVERAPIHELLDPEDLPKPDPDLPPSYKVRPFPAPTKASTDLSRNSSFPSRVSRVNAAIKSLIAVGGSRRLSTKCTDTQTPDVKCNELKQRYLFLIRR